MLWDPLRKSWVEPTPEEKVRQNLISSMIHDLGFPKHAIAVEKSIGDRRADLICYASVNRQIAPLLLIECKAEKIDEKAERQLLGYNSLIKAPFWCLAAAGEIKTMWHEQGRLVSVPFLPPYEQLVKCL